MMFKPLVLNKCFLNGAETTKHQESEGNEYVAKDTPFTQPPDSYDIF